MDISNLSWPLVVHVVFCCVTPVVYIWEREGVCVENISFGYLTFFFLADC
jgi:hypothetical protein